MAVECKSQGAERSWLLASGQGGLPGRAGNVREKGDQITQAGVQSLTSCREGKVLEDLKEAKRKTTLKGMMNSAFKKRLPECNALGRMCADP